MHVRRSQILDITSNYVGIFGNNTKQQQQPEEEEEKKKAGKGMHGHDKNGGEGMVMTQEQRRKNGHDTRTAEKVWS